jgi:hypothetical protein
LLFISLIIVFGCFGLIGIGHVGLAGSDTKQRSIFIFIILYLLVLDCTRSH